MEGSSKSPDLKWAVQPSNILQPEEFKYAFRKLFSLKMEILASEAKGVKNITTMDMFVE